MIPEKIGFIGLGQVTSPFIGQDDIPVVQIGPQGKYFGSTAGILARARPPGTIAAPTPMPARAWAVACPSVFHGTVGPI